VSQKGLRREEIARIEVGHTEITRAQAWCLVLAFLGVIVAVPVMQAVHEVRLHRAGRRATATPGVAGILPSVPRAVRLCVGAGATEADGPAARLFEANRLLLRDMRRYEDALAADSFLTSALVPPVQWGLTALLGAGNEQVSVGRGGWLFFRPGIDGLTGPGFLEPRRLAARRRSGSEWQPAPQPDPVLGVLHFQAQLAARGIRLVLVPAPSKAAVHPERLSRRYPGGGAPLRNRSYGRFVREVTDPDLFLRERLPACARLAEDPAFRHYGRAIETIRAAAPALRREPALVFIPAPALAAAARATGRPRFLAADTHWTPEAMGAVAHGLARFLEDRLGIAPGDRTRWKRTAVETAHRGDLAVMLKLPAGRTLYRPQRVTVQQVSDGKWLWRPDPRADILLLGDSFTNVYSLAAMGWGEAGGLAEQLSVELRRPLDVVARNSDGACATRRMLARELARGRDRLAGKRVVVWQFAARELAAGDWAFTDLRLGTPRPGAFFVPEPGTETAVTGTVTLAMPAPRPGTVPYRDHVVAVHLTDIESAAPRADGGQALVYMRSMRNNVWTRAARLRAGDRVTLRLRAWDDVKRKVGRINRTEIADDKLALEEPCWVEEIGR
jgi:alginate O-acetyltransferase complex protein AlgJ